MGRPCYNRGGNAEWWTGGLKRVRVAIDARLLAYQRAGTATYIRGILGGIEAHGGDTILVLASRKDPRRSELGPARRDVWTPSHHRWERWTLGMELAMAPVDVVHSPDFIPPRRLGRRWARVITVHDLAFLRWPDLLTPDARRYYGQIRDAVAAADRIIAVSRTTRQDLIDLVDRRADEKTVVVPEGVGRVFAPRDPCVAAGEVRKRFGIARPYFLFVGTIEPRKNLSRLLAAFGQFREKTGSDAPDLVLAGGRGWLDEGIDALAAPLGSAVRFLGRVPDDALVSLYNASVAHVLVSLYEGFGLPPLEAMACGKATLVSNTSSLPEVVGDAGLYVPPEDVEAIADALERLWEDVALRQSLGERGRLRAAAFDWASVGRQTRAVYEQAVACAS